MDGKLGSERRGNGVRGQTGMEGSRPFPPGRCGGQMVSPHAPGKLLKF